MLLFILAVFQHLLSGFKNASYYAGHDWTWAIFIGLMDTAFLTCGYLTHSWALFALPCVFNLFMVGIFQAKRTDRVHLFENLVQYSFVAAQLLAGCDIIMIVTASMAGNVLFNMPIQYQLNGHMINDNMGLRDKFSIRTWLGITNGWFVAYMGMVAAFFYIIWQLVFGIEVCFDINALKFIVHAE